MSVVQRKAILKAEGFFPHKKNAKGTTIIYSRNHPTAKFVRVVVDSGIDSKTNKIGMVRGGKVGVKLCYINRQKQWREITTEVFTTNTGLVKTIRAQEAAEKFVKTCKFCKAKKFAAKSGNVVCANACWTKWGGKKKSASPKKKSSQKIAAQKTKAARQKNLQRKKTAQKMTQRAAYKSSQKSSQKKLQKIVAEILPGDLVTVELLKLRKVTTDYTGSVLGIVTKVDQFGKVNVDWTANTSNIHEWEMPFTNHYADDCREVMRFKVLSRPVEYALVT